MLTPEQIKELRNRIEREDPRNGHLHIVGATKLVREAEAAARAEVEPLVRQMLAANSDLLYAMRVRPSCQARLIDRCRCLFCSTDRAHEAKKKSDDWLSPQVGDKGDGNGQQT